VERHNPDLWTDEFYFLNQPGQADIQSDLFYDYRTNVDSYPKWQAWMREKQPRLLVIWGKYESSFDPSEPEPIAAMSPKPKSTSSMAATSPWTPPQTKSPHWSKDSSVLHARALRRGERDEAAFERAGAQRCIGFEPLNRKVVYVGQENSNHNRSIGGYWRGFSRRVSERRL
jgi:hypothetical protein